LDGRCNFIKANGERCRGTATGKHGLCWAHDPANALLAAPMDDEERREMMALRDALVELLEGCSGRWEGTPTELHELLAERDLATLPDRPEELTKRLLNLARAGTAFTVSRGWRGKERVLRLHQHHDFQPPNGVGGVGALGGTTRVANTTYTTNTTNSDGNLSNGVGGSETALGPLERRERSQ
jgi:hypothetical protein